jgi:hypothetical protein
MGAESGLGPPSRGRTAKNRHTKSGKTDMQLQSDVGLVWKGSFVNRQAMIPRKTKTYAT